MNKEILRRFFEGWSSRWEKKQVQEYLEGEDMRVFDEYAAEQEANVQIEPNPAYKEMFFRDLEKRIQASEHPVHTKARFVLHPAVKVAASVIIVAVAGILLYLVQRNNRQSAPVADIADIENNGYALRMVQLSDATRVWITPGTILSYDKNRFNDSAREITVRGEAYFDVAQHKEKPFRVLAGGVTTTVLGTAFNVEAYRNETTVQVTLVRGLVQVNAAGETARLSAGNILTYMPGESLQVGSVDVSDKEQLFTTGRLVFENLLLKDVFARMERAFNIQLQVDETLHLNNKRISGSYRRDNPEVTLQRVLFIHGLHYKKKGGNAYVITR